MTQSPPQSQPKMFIAALSSAPLSPETKAYRDTIEFWIKVFTLIVITIPAFFLSTWSHYEKKSAKREAKLSGLRGEKLELAQEIFQQRSELRAMMRETLESRGVALFVSNLTEWVGVNNFDRAYLWQGELMASETQLHRAISLMRKIHNDQQDFDELKNKIRAIELGRTDSQNEKAESPSEQSMSAIPEGGSAIDYFGLAVVLAQNGEIVTSREALKKAITLTRPDDEASSSIARKVQAYDNVDAVTAKLLVQCDILWGILNFVEEHAPSPNGTNSSKGSSLQAPSENRGLADVFDAVGKTKRWQNLQGKLIQAAIVGIWGQLEAGNASSSACKGTEGLENAAKCLYQVDEYLQAVGRSPFTNVVGVHQDLVDATKVQLDLARVRYAPNLPPDDPTLEAATIASTRAIDSLIAIQVNEHNVVNENGEFEIEILRARHFLRSAIGRDRELQPEETASLSNIMDAEIIFEAFQYKRMPGTPQQEFWGDVLAVWLDLARRNAPADTTAPDDTIAPLAPHSEPYGASGHAVDIDSLESRTKLLENQMDQTTILELLRKYRDKSAKDENDSEALNSSGE